MNSQRSGPRFIANQNTSPSTRRGYQLTLVRAASIIIALLAITLFAAGLPALYLFVYESAENAGVSADLSQLGLYFDFRAVYAAYNVALSAGLAATCFLLATIIFLRRSEEPIALFVALVLVLLGATYPDAIPELTDRLEMESLIWLSYVLGGLSFGSMFVFLYIFPDGRFVPRWTRLLAILWLTWVMLVSFLPGSPFNPDYWPGTLFVAVMVSWLFTGVFAQVYRYWWVSGPVQRQQTKWVTFGFTTALLGYLGANFLADTFSSGQPGSLGDLARVTAEHFSILLIPLTFGIAILRYRLWDIDPIINRTLVFGVLTASVVGVYVLVVGSLGALLQTQRNVLVSLLAASLIAVLFAPLRDRLQRGVNRLMYGERDEPYRVLSGLGQRLGATLEPNAVLPTIVEAVAGALKLPYAAIAIKQVGGFETAAAYGSTIGEQTILPLAYQGETIGQLILAPRAPGERFTPADRHLLEALAHNAEVAVHAVRLNADLQRSRERLVTAREEERRRLRRDLHDGLGPTLAGLGFGLDGARSLLAQSPKDADTLLAELKAQTQAAVADIRRLVYDLRPPALDDLGLVPAIREQATSQGMIEDPAKGATRRSGLLFSMEAPEHLASLPAAVEVACYRIAREAITNVARYARARRCRVRLSIDEAEDALELEIADDGVGIPEDRRAGVGLTSMRERAAELGGTCMVASVSSSGGTRVLVWLPLPTREYQQRTCPGG